jgi:hypothetical protein
MSLGPGNRSIRPWIPFPATVRDAALFEDHAWAGLL